MKKKFFPLMATFAITALTFLNCGTQKKTVDISEDEREIFDRAGQDTVNIGSDTSEYEIIIIDPGFNFWLQSIARPEGYYSQTFLENRNQIYVINWNQRVIQPQQFNPNLYQLRIDYDPSIDYGYDINYKLYYYFIYFQRKYNQRLGPFLPRI